MRLSKTYVGVALCLLAGAFPLVRVTAPAIFRSEPSRAALNLWHGLWSWKDAGTIAVPPRSDSDPPQQLRSFLDFLKRCHSPGVVVCQGFDSAADYVPAVWPASGLYAAWGGAVRGTMDTKTKASGKASLRLEIPPYSAANAAGFWRQSFGRSFGAHSTFYIQFRQRFSPEMLTNTWGGNTSWKQAIFHGPESTCSEVELTTTNQNRWGIPIVYTDCGERGIYTNPDKATPNPRAHPPYLLQQGDFSCAWGEPRPTGKCFEYPSNEWVTFYYQVSIGDWGQPNSTIKAWVALDGQPYEQWVDVTHYVLRNKAPGKNDYSYVTLTPYMTNKDIKVNGGPTAYTWYDELIVSTLPIAPPAASDNLRAEAPEPTKP